MLTPLMFAAGCMRRVDLFSCFMYSEDLCYREILELQNIVSDPRFYAPAGPNAQGLLSLSGPLFISVMFVHALQDCCKWEATKPVLVTSSSCGIGRICFSTFKSVSDVGQSHCQRCC